jgi:L-lactate dehydrogenase (cytochrome)
MKFEAEDPSEVAKSGSNGVDRSQGAARAISVCLFYTFPAQVNLILDKSFIDPGLQWSDLDWFKSITNSTFIYLPAYACMFNFRCVYISAFNTERCSKMGG